MWRLIVKVFVLDGFYKFISWNSPLEAVLNFIIKLFFIKKYFFILLFYNTLFHN